MTQEDKDLLLKDLCARLPYGVKVHGNFPVAFNDGIIDDIKDIELDTSVIDWLIHGDTDIKPYLRTMSSMTEEEWELYNNEATPEGVLVPLSTEIDWLNAHHFDYRGLIEKGLAIAVTKENNPYK